MPRTASKTMPKRWALTAPDGGNRLEILGGFIPLSLAYNRGAAFGISLVANNELVLAA